MRFYLESESEEVIMIENGNWDIISGNVDTSSSLVCTIKDDIIKEIEEYEIKVKIDKMFTKLL